MSDNSGSGVFVLHSVSSCYAEVHISWENFLKAIAHSGINGYLCVEMSSKGLITQMSDECRKDVRWKKEDGRED